ncbi:sucrose-6-phosphate hydrolase SacC (GH32 family) [Paraburkholderia sp. JPY162]|uniref:Sucrose-6-phosphate hydrolase SacC (GH32 family) n=1 Tax=Paraburkholderia youngii TaxID=2782701 RepID=A0A7W8LEX9_9BURK|nr:sucrose-6-phosphate hydrolase SacC (GH32 family) [Paraburkholderia youngii]
MDDRCAIGAPGNTPLVALYTSVYKGGSGHAPGTQAQSLAYSLDHGATWRPCAHNPVLMLDPESKQFRDPKVSWYAPGGYWLMTTVVADAHVVKLYRSGDLIHWTFLSDFTLPDIPHDGAL